MLQVKQEPSGASFGVKVTPRASREEVGPVREGLLTVRLTAPPVEGAANAALIKLVAKSLGVAKGRVAVVGGQRSRSKRLLVEGLSPTQVRAALES